jgi:uncharacterized protein YegL
MAGKPIEELQNGIEVFHAEILEDSTTSNRLEIAIITFDSAVRVVQQPSLVTEFSMPKLQAKGATAMGYAIKEGIDLVSARKSWYKMTGQPYYRPWIILMTDGEPTDIPDINDINGLIQKNVDGKNFFFFSIGIEGANMERLKSISTDQMPPAKLEGLKFAEFFTWLSASMTQITSSAEGEIAKLPSPADWMQGFTIR